MNFFDAINPRRGDVIALIGGGGKTSIMYALGIEAAKGAFKTVLTTTTRIFYPENPGLQVIINDEPEELLNIIGNKLSVFPQIIAGTTLTSDNKIVGVNKFLINRFFEAGADLVVVEADGSARKPFKAPADHEPVVPPNATIVIPIIGIDCLGKPLNSHHVHRPELVAKLAETDLNEFITPEIIARVVTHPLGLRKGLPAKSRWIPFINKVDSADNLKPALDIALKIVQAFPCRVLIGSAISSDPIKRVI